MMKYIIRFPIGDWSDDGHGKCNWFAVESNKPVEDVRESHYACKNAFGFTPGELCHNYEEYYPDGLQVTALILAGIAVPHEDEFDSAAILQIWLDMLMKADPTLHLEVVPDNAERINFYGTDEQGRHLSTPGYGLFF